MRKAFFRKRIFWQAELGRTITVVFARNVATRQSRFSFGRFRILFAYDEYISLLILSVFVKVRVGEGFCLRACANPNDSIIAHVF
jgi:hypothetical protein